MRLVGGPPTECEKVSTKVREQKCLVSILGIFGFFDETAHQWKGRHNHSRNSSEITCLDASSHASHRLCTYTTPTHSKNGADKYAQTTRNVPHQNGFCGSRSRHPKHHDGLQKVHAGAAEGDRTPGGLRAGHALQIGGGGGVVSNHPQCITSERFLWLPHTRSRHPKHHDGLQKVYAGAAEGDRTPGGLGAGHRPKTSGAQGAYSATHGTRWGATARTPPLSQQIVTIRKHFRCKISRATLSHCSTLLGFGIAPRRVKCERHFGAARIYGCF
jgi:hypothetical protein